MKRILIFLGFIAFSLSSSALSGDEIWKSLFSKGEYRVPEVGYISAYTLYDVDKDGINECFMMNDDATAFAVYCCGDGSGKPSADAIHEVYRGNAPMALYIVRNNPFILLCGGCGTGCYYEDFAKLVGSRLATRYTCLQTVSPDGESIEKEYELCKEGEESRKISETLFNKMVPKKRDAIVIDEELKWIKLSNSSRKGDAVEVTLHSQDGDTIIVKDAKGYFYQLTGSDRAGVAPGGAYSGDIVIPSTIRYCDRDYTVTTVRRGAMWKKDQASNIGRITSISLPETVTLVGTDAFRDNTSLRTITYGKNTRIEVRSFYGCPNLQLTNYPVVYGYTEPFYDEGDGSRTVFSRMYVPSDKPMDDIVGYQWAVFKHHHNAVYFDGWQNMSKEDAMAAYCSDMSKVKAGRFILKDNSNVDAMFKGYRQSNQLVCIAHNNYIASHEFPIFSRYVWGEDAKSMPANFIASVAKKYGRKVKYSYEVAKLLYSDVPEQFVITEFEIVDGHPMVVFSWVRNGMEVCWHVMKGEHEVDDPTFSVWNVDDDGTYGIPSVLSITKDEKGNVEVFFNHSAPESMNLVHLVQNGTQFIDKGGDQWYVWYQ